MSTIQQALALCGYPPELGPKAEELFLYACKEGHIEAVRLYLELGLDPNAPRDQYGRETALIKATEGANIELIRLLLAAGADLEAKDNSGDTALFTARNWSHFEVFRFLLHEAGASPNTANRQHRSLFEVCLEANPDLVEDLLNCPQFNPLYGPEEGADSPLVLAAQKSPKQILPRLLATQPDLSRPVDAAGNPILLKLLISEQSSALNSLLQAGADPHQLNPYGWSAAMYAKRQGHKALKDLGYTQAPAQAQALTEAFIALDQGDYKRLAELWAQNPALIHALDHKGEDYLQTYLQALDKKKTKYQGFLDLLRNAGWPFDKCYPTDNWRTPLRLCVEHEQDALLEALMELGLAPNDAAGQCPALIYRAYSQDELKLKRLLAYGANPNTVDEDGSNALFMLAYKANAQSLPMLQALLDAGCELNRQGYDGKTPLCQSIYYKSEVYVAALLAAGADPNIPDKSGETPLMQCCKGYMNTDERWATIAQMLLDAGADFSLMDVYGRTPFEEARSTKNEPVQRVFKQFFLEDMRPLLDLKPMEWIEYLKILILLDEPERALDVLQAFNEPLPPMPKGYQTPLMLAVRQGHEPLVKALLAKGFDPNHTQMYGGSSLGIACYEGRLDLVQLLLAHGAEPNLAGESGETALHSACGEKGSLALVQLLEAHGAILAPEYPQGWTPLMRAIQGGQTDIVDYLLSKGAAAFSRNHYGHSTLHLALSRADSAMLDRLLPHQPLLDFVGEQKTTPLTFALGRKDLDKAEKLIKAGASLDFPDGHGQSPASLIHLRKDLLKAFKDYLPKAQAKAKNAPSRLDCPVSPLWAKVYARDLAGFAQLVEQETYSVDERNFLQETPLMAAVAMQDEDWVEFCLGRGADPKAKNRFGEDALGYGSFNASEAIETRLKAAGAEFSMDTLNAKAARSMREEEALKLLKKGDAPGLIKALQNGQINPYLLSSPLSLLSFTIFLNESDMLKALAASGLDFNLIDGTSETPLSLTVREGKLPLFKILHKAGANPHLSNAYGLSLLEQGLASNNAAMLSHLLKLGLNAQQLNPHSGLSLLQSALVTLRPPASLKALIPYCPIELADAQGRSTLEVLFLELYWDLSLMETYLKLLLAQGADPNTCLSSGPTLLAYTLEQADKAWQRMAKLLLKAGAQARQPGLNGYPSAYELAERSNLDYWLKQF